MFIFLHSSWIFIYLPVHIMYQNSILHIVWNLFFITLNNKSVTCFHGNKQSQYLWYIPLHNYSIIHLTDPYHRIFRLSLFFYYQKQCCNQQCHCHIFVYIFSGFIKDEMILMGERVWHMNTFTRKISSIGMKWKTSRMAEEWQISDPSAVWSQTS